MFPAGVSGWLLRMRLDPDEASAGHRKPPETEPYSETEASSSFTHPSHSEQNPTPQLQH